jgi:hypothetical protein
VVYQYFNDSTGRGDNGDVDARGPWNEGDVDYVEAPAQPIAQATEEEVAREIGKTTRGGRVTRVSEVSRHRRNRS